MSTHPAPTPNIEKLVIIGSGPGGMDGRDLRRGQV